MAISLITNALNKKAPPQFQTSSDPTNPSAIDFETVLELDAAVHETHEYTNTITDFPVEKGFSISDHVFKVPEKLTLEGFVTNSPIPYSVNNVSVLLDSGDRVNSSFEKLMDLAGYDPSGKMVTVLSRIRMPSIIKVVTGLRVYSNMLITHLSFPRDITTGESLRFTCELRRVVVVDAERAIIKNASELNGRAVNADKQAPTKVDKSSQPVKKLTQEEAGSKLFQLEDMFSKLGKSLGYL